MSASGRDVNSLQFLYTLLKMKDPKGGHSNAIHFYKQRHFIGIDGSMKKLNIYGKFPFHKRFIIVE